MRILFAALETGLTRAEVVQWADGPVLLVPEGQASPVLLERLNELLADWQPQAEPA